MSARTLSDRLWSRVIDRPSGCREWVGYVNTTGYGQISDGARLIGTHRAAWIVVHGSIPVGLFVLHKCDNRVCCNPDHLFLGTVRDNSADMRAKGRGRGAQGPANANAKLSAAQVESIRSRYVPGRGGNVAELAAEFGITTQYVNQLANGIWRKAA